MGEARKDGGWGCKSIPQVNLRLEIFYTINKQGESGGLDEGEDDGAGKGSGSRMQS